ncbi:hypothetical protein LCGC14_3098470, partial [marine sediment metagenome]
MKVLFNSKFLKHNPGSYSEGPYRIKDFASLDVEDDMKAAVIHQFGDPDVLRYEEIATPKPKPGHVLVKVLAAGVNRFDHY